MTATTLEPRYRAHIEGDVYGQVAVGENVIQIGHISGGKVEIYQGGPPRRRPTPQARPRPFPRLLGRDQEVSLISSALNAAEVVEIAGRPGIGKTSLVRHLAHIVPPATDGVVHHAPGPRPLEDVLQLLFDAFYTSDIPTKRRYGELVSDLKGIRALIYLDDLELSRDEVGRLLDALPASTVLIVSTERKLFGGAGRSLALRGLPVEESLALLEQELGRRLAAEERDAAQTVVQALDGHPLDILRAAARAREEGWSLAQLAAQLPSGDPSRKLAGSVVSSLTNPEKQIVAALAAVEGVPLHEEHLAAISPALAGALEELLAKNAIQAHSPEYSLTGNLEAAIPEAWLPSWREWLLNHFVRWATSHRTEPELLLRDAPAMLRILDWAVETGRWAEALALIQVLEPAMALDRQWAASRQTLTWALQGAQATGNAAVEAWSLHQQGTYALGLGDQEIARAALQQALVLREQLGDQIGAALTRHNLGFLAGPPPPPSRPEPGPEQPSSLVRPLLAGIGILGVIGVLVVVLIFIINRNGEPPVVNPPGRPTEPVGPPEDERPDLVIEDWGAMGEPFLSEGNFPGQLLVPMELIIQNQGPAPAGPFFVSVHTTRGPCDELLPFYVNDQQEFPFPEIEGLPAGERLVLDGFVALLGARAGSTCALVARVDSSAPDPGLPETGRVLELDEGNNQSRPVIVNLREEASDNPPTVEIISPKAGSIFGPEGFDEEFDRWFAIVPLQALAFDAEDGELSPRSIQWETSRADLQDPSLGRGNGLEVRLYGSAEVCAGVRHEIIVTVTDSNGNTAQASVVVEVIGDC